MSIRAFNVFCPLPPPAHPSSRCYRQAALHAHAVWLPGGCFAGVHYRRRDGRWFRQAARPDSVNDLGMVRAYQGAVPDVADPEIKKEATQIVKSVAEFLENF